MTPALSQFAARLRGFITNSGCYKWEFNALALELFALQFEHNPVYRKICESRRVTPLTVSHWSQIPAVPTAAFKEFELTSLASNQRTHVFHSSGTTEQRPSLQFHNAESLGLYETSLRSAFPIPPAQRGRFLILTPFPADVPHSSLVHMFDTLRLESGAPESAFVGGLSDDGAWLIDFDAALTALNCNKPLFIFGTAFSFVHLLDWLARQNLRFQLPSGSRVLETGGYKARSRSMPKEELHALITKVLGVPRSHIICEYGMSELSSQAYDCYECDETESRHPSFATRHLRFPPWARAQVISPETGHEVGDGETGLIRVFDLANVFAVMAIQTEDLGIRRGDGFELIGRAALAEPRGCSLMAV